MLHGLDCLGCCVGLMVGLVALGMMNLVLVFTAALILFAEKTLPDSHRIARPLGFLMIPSGMASFGFSLLGGMEAGMAPTVEGTRDACYGGQHGEQGGTSGGIHVTIKRGKEVIYRTQSLAA